MDHPPGGHAAHGQPLCWEQILQKKTITVLLVETDECTRTAIAAMLRACDYTVIAPKDGKHAWACIQGMHSGIDLVLTEADLSGIELLQRIMDHPVCRTIPVIAMSRSDSMRTVFSCLSKGAVDFLQKPIRKNELRNLWQHVWRRRCLNSSGTGTGTRCAISGSPVQPHQYYYIEPKSGHESNTNTAGAGSNHRSKGLDDNDMSGGTQGSWTKRAVEIDGPQAMSSDQSTEIPDSTCALVIHPISGICNTGWLPDEFKWKGLKIGDHTYANRENESCLKGCPDRRCEYPAHNSSNASAMEHPEESVVRTVDLIGSMAGSNEEFKEKDLPIDESYPNGSSIKPTNGWCVYPRQNNCNASTVENLEEPIVGTADLIGSMAKNMDVQLLGRAKDAPGCSSKVPSLELSLKRPISAGYYANSIQKAVRNVSRQHLSALRRIFTRYGNTYQGGAGMIMRSSSPHGNNFEAVKTTCPYKMMPSSDASLMTQGKYTNCDENMPWLELSSKRPRTTGDGANNAILEEHRNDVLTQSDLLAFTRYDASNEGGGTCWLAGSCLPHGEAQSSNHNCAVLHGENNGGSVGANQSNVTDPAWAPVEGSNNNNNNNNTDNGRTAATGVNSRVAARNRYNEKKKRRNFAKTVRYRNRKAHAEKRPRVRGQFIRQPPPTGEGFER